MSQVTRCPACGTRFKVVADQLRISQGWVRCGVCHEVFDASQDLLPMPVPAGAVPAAQPSAPAAPSSAPGQSSEPKKHRSPPQRFATDADAGLAHGRAAQPRPGPDLLQGLRIGVDAGHPPGADRMVAAEPPNTQDFDTLMSRFVGDEMDLLAQPRVLPSSPPPSPPFPSSPSPLALQGAGPMGIVQETLPPPPEPGPEPEQTPAPPPPATPPAQDRPAPVPAEQAAPSAVAVDEEARPEASASVPSPEFSRWPESGDQAEALPEAEPGFVREARRKAFWRKPAVRGLLLLASLGCVAALAAQIMWQQRDALAVQHPALAPALRTLCSMAGCELQPRRQIADVVISSSGFRQTPRSGRYQWSLSLENRSDFPVAMPAVELTLTDAQDKPLLRRVIRLDQLGAPAQIEAHGEWSVTAAVEVQDLGAAIAGYRALVFYP